MLADLLTELGSRGASVLLGLVIGAAVTAFVAHFRRRAERRLILAGDARDTVTLELHVLEYGDDGEAGPVPLVLRIRTLGQGELRHVVPNGHLAGILRRRARKVTTRDTLISMEGAEGSYLLETLMGFVCDRVANAPFEHDLYVMAACCEPQQLSQHQPITILLIALSDLAAFDTWQVCRELHVERGGAGARVLTLMSLARRYRQEQEEIARRREQGQRTTYVETMYVLDLALDRAAGTLPTKPVPWGRLEGVLKEWNLE